MSANQHILLLGASSETGVELIQLQQSLASDERPYLTLFIRASGRPKIARVLKEDAIRSPETSRLRVVEGALTDKATVKEALTSDQLFPAVTAVISTLGAYPSLTKVFTRDKSTPIADALRGTVIPTMRDMGVGKLMVLSTPCGAPQGTESKDMSWSWWFALCAPPLMVPQGNAEMKGIANAAMEADGIEYIVVRVPFLSTGGSDFHVVAGYIGSDGFPENKSLSRGSLARWMFNELNQEKWVGKAPALANP